MALFDKVLNFLPALLLLLLTYPYLNTSPSCHLPRKIRVMKTPSLLSNSKTPSEPTDISRFPCGTCDLTVDSDDDLGVACDGCGLWYHLACQNIPSGEYDQLGDSNVIWHCSICEFVNRQPKSQTSQIPTSPNSSCQTLSFLSINSVESTFVPVQSSTPTRARRQEKQLSRPLRLLNVNFGAGGIIAKTEKITELLQRNKPDILFGTETWLGENISDSEILPPGYNIYRLDRKKTKEKKKGGGVLLAISKTLTSHKVPELAPDGCEIVWAKIQIKGKRHLLVASYYRPNVQDEASLNLFETATQRASLSNSTIIIGGDLNFPSFDWKRQGTLKENPTRPDLHYKFLDIIQDSGLEQMVTDITRPASGNTLDLFLTNYPSLIPHVEVIDGVSDHSAVSMEVNARAPLQKQKARDVHIYKKADWPSLKKDASSLSKTIVPMEDTTTTGQIWDTFLEGLKSTTKTNIPKKTIGNGTKQHKPWVDYKTLKMIRRRDRLYKWLKKAGCFERKNGKKKVKKESASMDEIEKER